MKTIKTALLLLAFTITVGQMFAGFTSAKLKVTGVTCSMCSNSVHKALSSLTFIDKINVDLQKAVYEITFKEGEKVNMDEIKNKVEGAGFSVGELTAEFNFDNLDIAKDFHYQFEGNTYHFVGVTSQKLDKQTTIRFVDKGLTSKKEFKKYTGMTRYSCIKSGKTESCCKTEYNQRIYHVTL